MRQIFLSLIAVWMTLAACHNDTVCVDALAFKATSKDKWGLIATDGQILVPAHTFNFQPTAVVNGMFSLPDGKGFHCLYSLKHPERPVSPRRFARIGHFFEDVAPAQETTQSPVIFINKQGHTVTSTARYPQYDIALVHNFHEGRALFATREGKYGYMDTKGNIVIPPLYDRAYDFYNGLALVGLTNSLGETGYQLIAPNGKIRLAIQLSNCMLSDRLGCRLLMFRNRDTGQCCYLDEEGVSPICLPEEIKEAYTFRHHMAVFQTATGTGVIDAIGNVLVGADYESAIIVGKGRIGLKTGGQWAMAESSGQMLGNLRYDTLGTCYNSGLTVARMQGQSLFINRDGHPADNNRYACIAEDATALQECPQVFIYQKEEIKKAKTEVLHTAKADKRTTVTSEKTDIPAPKSSLPARSVISTDSWRQIGRQNPFYAEAEKVLSGKLEETDAGRRRMILNYVEHLRTSYITKDIDFLEQLFSENALIIVGTVVRTGLQAEGGYLSPSQVVYNIKSKREYLDRLKQVFKANKSIRVDFSRFHITRHPTQPGIYGVSLRQGYSSDIYSDDGYLFLLWDFRDETAPQIHVRTWQPSLSGSHDQTPLPEEEIFNIQNFNLQ